MSPTDMTKKQLQEEVLVLRRRVSELEQKLAGYTNVPVQERMPRSPMHAQIEFIGDFDVVNARGVNISDGGICLRLADDLPFEMQFVHEGRRVQRRAHLVWLKRHDSDGGYHSGFKFVEQEPSPQF